MQGLKAETVVRKRGMKRSISSDMNNDENDENDDNDDNDDNDYNDDNCVQVV